MRRVLTVLALLLGLPLSVAACLWDSDTPADEARDLPEVIAVLTGRFERNPPLYYQMRLGRMTARLQGHPDDLAAYEDAGVACDRLGRGDEAISSMDKKRAQLDRLDSTRPEVKEQLYRYHANLGTFLAHRWMREGADRAKIDQLKKGRQEIAKALEINPNAHFGREKYELRLLEWIIDPPRSAGLTFLPNLLGWDPLADDVSLADPKAAYDAVQGLTALIVLGNGWESVDVFHALNVALHHDALGNEKDSIGGRNTLAYFATLRCNELIDAGNHSMLPDAPRGDDLKRLLPYPNFIEQHEWIEPEFVKLRAQADAWHNARTAFMTARLASGRHPDTDRGFWNGFTEQTAPSVPKDARLNLLGSIGVLGVAFASLIGFWAVRLARTRRNASRPLDDVIGVSE